MHTAKCLFAECQNKGTRQNTSLPSAKTKALGKDAFCRVPKNSTRQNTSLPSARNLALGKDGLCRVRHSANCLFAECPCFDTRQSAEHSAKSASPVVFLCEAELFCKNYLAKQLYQQLHVWMRERNKGESQDKLLFQLYPNSWLCERRRKTASPMKLF